MLDGGSGAKAAGSLGFLLQRKSHSNGTLRKAARHAVLGTLYSRAHRIGLDEVSCLLDGFRKKISFSLFAVVVVCVLVCPAPEVIILAEQKLQSFGNHVRRGSIDELSVEL